MVADVRSWSRPHCRPDTRTPGALAIGIGLNVNQTCEDLSTIAERATTSLAIETGRSHDRGAVLCCALRALDRLLDDDRRPLGEQVLAEWRSSDVCLGARVRIRAGGGEFIGMGRDVTDEGLLIVEDEDSITTRVACGDVHVAMDDG